MDEDKLLSLLLGKLDGISDKLSKLDNRLSKLETSVDLFQETRKDHLCLVNRVTTLETKLVVYSSVAGVVGSVAGVVATLLLGK